MFASKSERKVHYSIRKFSIGVASVVVASLFLGGVVHAEGVRSGDTPKVTSSGDEVESHLKKILSEIQTQLDRKRHAKTVALINKLQDIKRTYSYKLNVLEEKPKAELTSKAKAELDAAFEQFKKEPELTKKVAEAQKKVEEAKKKAEDQKEEDFRNYPTNTYKTIELEIAESDVKVKEAELELLKEEAKEHRDEGTIKQVEEKVKSEKAEATRLEEIKTERKKAEEEAKRKAEESEKKAAEAKQKVDTKEQGKPKRRAKRGVSGELATPDKKENDAKSSDSSVGEETLPSPSLNMANESQTEHRKDVDEYIKKMLSEIQLDRRKHTQNVNLNIKLSAIKTKYLYELSVLKENSKKEELTSKTKAELTAAFEQFKKDTLKPEKKVAEAEKKVEEAKKKAKDQKEEDRRNYPTNTYKTLELEIAESDVKVKEAELELVKEEANESRNEEKIKQAKEKVESKKAEATRLEKIKTDRKKAEEEAKRKAEESEKKAAEAKQKVDAEEYALEAKIAELEYEVQRLEKELKEIDESDSEDYLKEGLRAPLQSKLDTKKAKLSKLEELSDKIDELDAEIAKLEVQLKDAEGNNNVEAYFKEGLEKTTAEKKAELEKAEADLKKAVDEPETPAPAPQPAPAPEKPAEKPAPAPAPEKPAPAPEKPAPTPETPKTGWKQENGMWYFYNTDGSMA
ncbi:RICH domain-containing protein, partial [Streptococcus pneumoniae]